MYLLATIIKDLYVKQNKFLSARIIFKSKKGAEKKAFGFEMHAFTAEALKARREILSSDVRFIEL